MPCLYLGTSPCSLLSPRRGERRGDDGVMASGKVARHHPVLLLSLPVGAKDFFRPNGEGAGVGLCVCKSAKHGLRVTVQVSWRGAFFATKQSPRYDLRWTTLGIASQKSLAMTEWAERLRLRKLALKLKCTRRVPDLTNLANSGIE